MDASVIDFCNFITNKAVSHNKDLVQHQCKEKFHLIQDGKVFYTNFFAVRFCYSKDKRFNNVVLALSKLQKYDTIPFLVVLISGTEPNKVFLANTTMLNKISHSSQDLSVDNIRGSFLGSNIIKKLDDGTENIPQNFEILFAIHEAKDWDENLQRLCEATTGIVSSSKKFLPSNTDKKNIFNSVDRAVSFVRSRYFNRLKKDLDSRVESCKDTLFIVSKIENNNIKGRLIEILITSDEKERKKLLKDLANVQVKLPTYNTKNGLGDYEKKFPSAHAYVDIKVKVIYLNSNPKAFNIDKFLRTMSEKNSIFLLYFVGFDEKSLFNTVLCSVYNKKLLNSLIVQKHWAGRGSRGCAQYNGNKIKEILKESNFVNDIDIEESKNKIEELLKLGE